MNAMTESDRISNAGNSIPGARLAARAIPSGRSVYRSVKRYDHSEGLSCSFRQWRATHSHCRFIHGYALGFRFVFATHILDENNWCLDFGGLKPVRMWLHDQFDHTTLVADDDPEKLQFEHMQQAGLMQLRVLAAVGCEAIAKYVSTYVCSFVTRETQGRVWLESVEVSEHGGNAAIYTADGPVANATLGDAE